MAHGTLANLGKSSFVRTPPLLALRIVRSLLVFPDGEGSNILDPTAGEGDLLFPCWDTPQARLFGVEISSARASTARRKLPHATIVTSAFEGVTIAPGSMSLVLANPPYFFQDGKRAEYRILADAGELLMPGGILVAILPARSAWDGTMVNHWCKWYDSIRVWKFPDRVAADDESAFEDFTQIVVIGRRLASPQVTEAAQKKHLQGFRWRKAEQDGASVSAAAAGWERGVPPPEIPTTPVADPYAVPAARMVPTIVVRNADEATLLYALANAGAHLSAQWQTATTWPQEGLHSASAMPYTGEAHVAAEFLTGVLDGEIVTGPGNGSSISSGGGAEARAYLFTTFVGQEWVARGIDGEEREKMRERGVVHVSMRQTQDKPILGVLDLARGSARYYQGDEVFTFLQPWLQTLAARVVERRTPLYQLNPEEWEVRVISQFGTDKQLPGAPFAGLAPAQMHRVFALCRCIDVKGRAAIQGEPGTGKTRLAGATAALMAYRWRWRQRQSGTPNAADGGGAEFQHTVQPQWVSGLRRAWLKNPLTLALLELEPVLHAGTGQVVAYRNTVTGRVMAPEEAGPAALPVLVTTPKKVTREYGLEIEAAWPEAEVVFIKTHSDIPLWLARCAHSTAPAVIAVFSHSTTRAFGREWQPAVLERTLTRQVPTTTPTTLSSSKAAAAEVGRSMRSRPNGSGSAVVGAATTPTPPAAKGMKIETVSHFYCPNCSVARRYALGSPVGRIEAVPGQRDTTSSSSALGEALQRTTRLAQGRVQSLAEAEAAEEEEEQVKERERRSEPVSSLGWFRQKPRWCLCPTDRRNEERRSEGRLPLRTPLWSDMRTAATQRKNPQLPFAAWSQAMTALVAQAQQAERTIATAAELVPLVQSDDALLARLIEAGLRAKTTRAALTSELTRHGETAVGETFATLVRDEAELAQMLVAAFNDSEPVLAEVRVALQQRGEGENGLRELLLAVAKRDVQTLATLVQVKVVEEKEEADLTTNNISTLLASVKQREATLASVLGEAVLRHPSALELLIEGTKAEICWLPVLFAHGFEEAHATLMSSSASSSSVAIASSSRAGKPGQRPLPRGVRLVAAEDGPIAVSEPDLSAADGYTPVRDAHRKVVAYRPAVGNSSGSGGGGGSSRGTELTPLYSPWSQRVVGYRSSQTGQVVTKEQCYAFRMPPADSFSPYHYLYTFYPGCVALSVVDESHNGRGRDTDIAHAHHFAMLAAQARLLTSGTHYGGDILGFYHYWLRFNPSFWLQHGYGWNDAEKALAKYGVIQEWTKEFESEARRGSGQTTVQVSTIPAPGLSATLIPRLLEDLCYLTVLDVGAYMPPRIEIPEIASMRDAAVEEAQERVGQEMRQAEQALATLRKNREHSLLRRSVYDSLQLNEALAARDTAERTAMLHLTEVSQRAAGVKEWALPRNLAHHYMAVVRRLEKLSEERNNAARMAKGTVPRWFAALPCQSPFEVWQTERSDWGDTLDKHLLIRTPVLEWNHLYPLEKRLLGIVEQERAEGRRVMVYFEQNDIRSMAKRLEWVLKEYHPWTLPNTVEAEERQQTILAAVASGHSVLIVPYRRVNEGLNLQHAVDSIVWYEMALNLFMLDQASRRAWRLGKREEVRIYYLVYAGTAGHAKLRKLGGQSGAAAAFAGEPARGALIEHAGAQHTTLARLSACLEDSALLDDDDDNAVADENNDVLLSLQSSNEENAALQAAFAQRGEQLREALKRGRQWFGAVDTLAERLAAIHADPVVSSVWAITPQARSHDVVRVVEALPLQQDTTSVVEHTDTPSVPEKAGASAPLLLLPSVTEQRPREVEPVALPVLPAVSPPPHEGERVLAHPADPAQRADGTVATTTTAGKKQLVFGLAEHIQLVRTRRTRAGRATSARSNARTEVHTIPALHANTNANANGVEEGVPVPQKAATVSMLSLWDDLAFQVTDEGKTNTTSPVAPTSVTQSKSLWTD